MWLVGAGPGDPDLLTRKAERLIRAASVVFHDALIGPGILDLVPRSARLVPVGKRAGRHSSTQEEINALLVEAGLAGERVVRLKGGDPSVFGRSAEEVDALTQAGVPVHICPGITAASAAAASAGISLTLRGSAREVRFVTAQTRSGSADDLDWASLSSAESTLAFYMGRMAAPQIQRQLLAHGLASDTPVLVVSNVSLANEKLVQTRLDLLSIAIDDAANCDAAVILVGRAVRQRREAVRRAVDAVPQAIPDDGLRVVVTGAGVPASLSSLPATGSVGIHPDIPTASLPLVDVGQATSAPGKDFAGAGMLMTRKPGTFVDKIDFAAGAGAAFAVIVNNEGTDQRLIMRETGFAAIPAVLLGHDNGEALRAQVATNPAVPSDNDVHASHSLVRRPKARVCAGVRARDIASS